MTITQLIIHEQSEKRAGKLKQHEIDYFQSREGIRTDAALADVIISVFKRCHPQEITLLRYLEEIADEQAQQQPVRLAKAA